MKYLIVANGPFLTKALIVKAAQGACIIALDGAANKLARLGIMPDIILGDFDSFQEETCFAAVEKIILPDQNFTDFQKALKFAKQNATSIHVVCALGGRLDHDQANIRSLKSEYSLNCPIYLHNDFQTMTYACNETVHIRGQHHDYCGLFGMPEAVMIVKNQGLEYGGDTPFSLTLTQSSSSNRLLGDEGAILEIQGNALIVHPLLVKQCFI
ncbi:MAG: thiamine diphosphokinase [Pseudomonadota bacterium]